MTDARFVDVDGTLIDPVAVQAIERSHGDWQYGTDTATLYLVGGGTLQVSLAPTHDEWSRWWRESAPAELPKPKRRASRDVKDAYEQQVRDLYTAKGNWIHECADRRYDRLLAALGLQP